MVLILGGKKIMCKNKRWIKEIVLTFLIDEETDFPHEISVRLNLHCHHNPNFGSDGEHKGIAVDFLDDWEILSIENEEGYSVPISKQIINKIESKLILQNLR